MIEKDCGFKRRNRCGVWKLIGRLNCTTPYLKLTLNILILESHFSAIKYVFLLTSSFFPWTITHHHNCRLLCFYTLLEEYVVQAGERAPAIGTSITDYLS